MEFCALIEAKGMDIKMKEKVFCIRNIVKIITISFFMVCVCLMAEERVYADGTYQRSNHASSPICCFTETMNNGNIRVIYRVKEDGSEKQKLKITEITPEGKQIITSLKTVELPYSLWGGEVYKGGDGCYYIAVGEDCTNNENLIAYCFIKYDSNWNEMGRYEVSGKESGTKIPFRAGSCDMILSGSHLYVNTCKQAPNGHQGSHRFVIQSATMEKKLDFPWCVSHSFNQLMFKSENRIVFVDHGDGYPRGIQLESFLELEDYLVDSSRNLKFESLVPMTFKGRSGENATGVTVTGVHEGEENNLIIGSGVDHSSITKEQWEHGGYELYRNIFAISTSKDLQNTQCRFLTNYDMSGDTDVSDVISVKYNQKIYVLYRLWIDNYKYTKTGMMVLDEQGNLMENKIIDQEYSCYSTICMSGNSLYWCDYENLKLGCSLVFCRWNLNENKYTATNVDTGEYSNITDILVCKNKTSSSFFNKNSKKLELTLGEKIEVKARIFSNIGREKIDTDEELSDCMTPIVWNIGNTNIANLRDNTTRLNGTVSLIGDDKYLSMGDVTDLTALKAGKTTLSVQCCDKKKTISVVVKYPKINPVKKLRISSKKRALTVSWKKQKKISGYEIQIAKDRKYKKGKKIKTLSKNKTRYTFKKLKGKKQYFIRMRAYRYIDGKKVYSIYRNKKGKTK